MCLVLRCGVHQSSLRSENTLLLSKVWFWITDSWPRRSFTYIGCQVFYAVWTQDRAIHRNTIATRTGLPDRYLQRGLEFVDKNRNKRESRLFPYRRLLLNFSERRYLYLQALFIVSGLYIMILYGVASDVATGIGTWSPWGVQSDGVIWNDECHPCVIQ